jgi:uncharacterized protein YfeS
MKKDIDFYVKESLEGLSDRVTLSWQNTTLIITGKIDHYFTQKDLEDLNWNICNKWKSLTIRLRIEKA